MNFFVNYGLGHGNSGVEHAQFYRAELFRNAKLPFKLIYTNLLPEMHTHIKEWGLAENEVINLYDFLLAKDPKDYLQNGTKKLQKYSTDTLWDKSNTQRVITTKATGGYTIIWQRDKTYSEEKKILLVEDARTTIISDDKKRKITWHFVANKRVGKVPRNIHLYNFEGEDYLFLTFDELLNFFYDYLAKFYAENNIFFMDRGTDNDEAVLRAKDRHKNIQEVAIVHAAHLSRHANGHPLWNNYYQYTFDHIMDFDKVILATNLQRQALAKDYGKRLSNKVQKQLVTIPVGGLAELPKERKWDGKTLKFVTASRLHPEKHVAHIINAIEILRNKGLNATLSIFGAGSDEKDLQKQIDDKKLNDFVKLEGLSQTMEEDLKRFDAFVSASYSEGFGLTYLESIGQALPIATYANLFGAQELVKNDKNGYLADFKRSEKEEDVLQNTRNLALAMESIFKNQKHYAKLSANAVAMAKLFLNSKIQGDWEKLVKELNNEN